MRTTKPFDFLIFISVLILVLSGIIMVLSSSSPSSYVYHENTFYFLESQLKYAVIGFIVLFFAANINYKRLGKISPVLLILTIVMLILVLIPGIGRGLNGARRWIFLGSNSIQPSEFIKFTIILFLSYSLSKKTRQLDSFYRNFLPYIVVVGIIGVLLLLEPHYSCTIIVIAVSAIILFCAGAKIRHFLLISIPTVFLLGLAIFLNPYMQSRMASFLNPNSDKLGNNMQITQSVIAIGSGGIWGKGLGRSIQKYLWLPEPQNDFIVAIIAEELGFIGILFILSLYIILIWRGIKVASHSDDLFGCLLATGITSLIAVQAVFNIAVVTHLVPTTGVSMPFLSSGGTSLVCLMGGVGILLNISRYANYERV
jgi:cell division protein FtsW